MLKNMNKAIRFEIMLGAIMLVGLIFNNSISLDAVEVYVDGQKIQEEFLGYTQSEIEYELKNKFNTGLESDNYLVINDLDTDSAVKDDVITFATEKNVAIKINNEIKTINTFAITVAELKSEMKLENINTNYEDTELLSDIGLENGVLEFEQEINTFGYKEMILRDVNYVNDPNILVGQEKIVQEGSDGYNLYQTNEVFVNGKLEKEETTLLSSVAPKEKIIKIGTKEIQHSADWASVAQCESTGNWSIDSGNGYYGGLQIAKPTWDTYAPLVGVSAQYPHEASMNEQILVAEAIYSSQGQGAWGNCI